MCLILYHSTTNKRTCKIVDFSVPSDYRLKLKIKKKKNEKKNKYLDLAMEFLKNWKHESNSYNNSNWYSLYSHQKIGKRTRGVGNKKMSEDHQTRALLVSRTLLSIL